MKYTCNLLYCPLIHTGDLRFSESLQTGYLFCCVLLKERVFHSNKERLHPEVQHGFSNIFMLPPRSFQLASACAIKGKY